MLKTDLHVHTLASGHAYSTILESVQFAASVGVETIAITDHGPSTAGGPHIGYFTIMDRIPRKMNGLNVLMGCEANVIDCDGKIDLPASVADRLDILLAGLHEHTPYSVNLSSKENTVALIRAIEKNAVHIVSHPHRPNFPMDICDLIKAANNCGAILELNLSLLKMSEKDKDFLRQIYLMIEIIGKFGGKLAISSDAHIATEIGDDSILSKLNIRIPDELVLGSQKGYNEIKDFLSSRR